MSARISLWREDCLMALGILLLLLLAGCNSEFAKTMARAEVNERIRLNCVPEQETFVVVGWHKGYLVCKHVFVNERPSKREPHIDIEPRKVASVEELVD
jgi:hypothetical protein